jgi:hypothetical protein
MLGPGTALPIGPCRHGTDTSRVVPCPGTTGRAVLRAGPISPARLAIYRRQRGRRISTPKDDSSAAPGPSPPGSSLGIRLEQTSSAGHPEASASYPLRTSARLVASATRLRRWSHQWTARPSSGRRSLLFEPTPPLSVLTPLPPASAHRRAAEGSFD